MLTRDWLNHWPAVTVYPGYRSNRIGPPSHRGYSRELLGDYCKGIIHCLPILTVVNYIVLLYCKSRRVHGGAMQHGMCNSFTILNPHTIAIERKISNHAEIGGKAKSKDLQVLERCNCRVCGHDSLRLCWRWNCHVRLCHS